jgi:hypothetical protein
MKINIVNPLPCHVDRRETSAEGFFVAALSRSGFVLGCGHVAGYMLVFA